MTYFRYNFIFKINHGWKYHLLFLNEALTIFSTAFSFPRKYKPMNLSMWKTWKNIHYAWAIHFSVRLKKKFFFLVRASTAQMLAQIQHTSSYTSECGLKMISLNWRSYLYIYCSFNTNTPSRCLISPLIPCSISKSQQRNSAQTRREEAERPFSQPCPLRLMNVNDFNIQLCYIVAK